MRRPHLFIQNFLACSMFLQFMLFFGSINIVDAIGFHNKEKINHDLIDEDIMQSKNEQISYLEESENKFHHVQSDSVSEDEKKERCKFVKNTLKTKGTESFYSETCDQKFPGVEKQWWEVFSMSKPNKPCLVTVDTQECVRYTTRRTPSHQQCSGINFFWPFRITQSTTSSHHRKIDYLHALHRLLHFDIGTDVKNY